jgi:hypothetical protein
MAHERAPHVAAAFASAAVERAEFIRTTQYVAQVMGAIALARENAADNYRRMASGGGSHAGRYLRLAEQFDHSAARARRFARQELEVLANLQPPDDPHGTAGWTDATHA